LNILSEIRSYEKSIYVDTNNNKLYRYEYSNINALVKNTYMLYLSYGFYDEDKYKDVSNNKDLMSFEDNKENV